MSKKLIYFSLCLLAVSLLPTLVYADTKVVVENYQLGPFVMLAGYAGKIGCGLRKVGLIIAGLGLIVVTMGAIFGKVNWKTLSYIMLSCFILAAMAGVAGLATRGGEGTDGNINQYCGDTVKGRDIDIYVNTSNPSDQTPGNVSKSGGTGGTGSRAMM